MNAYQDQFNSCLEITPMATIVIRDRKKNSTWPRELRYIIVILFDAAFSWPKKRISRKNEKPRKVRRRKIDDTRPAVAICARRYFRQMYSYAPLGRRTHLHDAKSATISWYRARREEIVGGRGLPASFSPLFAFASLF